MSIFKNERFLAFVILPGAVVTTTDVCVTCWVDIAVVVTGKLEMSVDVMVVPMNNYE